MRLDWIGWVATAAFASSYLFKRPEALRRVQAGAAMLWILYGVIIHAYPVIAANVAVAAMAIFSSPLGRRKKVA
ncbi:MAG: hypothetical protein WB424_15715 [Terracidiphilus sp.]|jgi:hypothetical protein